MKSKILRLTRPLLLIAGISNAMGALTITAIETGGNVVFSGEGTLDLTSLVYLQSGGNLSGINPSEEVLPVLTIGPFPGTVDEYGFGNISTPPSFGTSGWAAASSGTGDSFGTTVNVETPTDAVIWVPSGYVSGSPLSGSMTFTGETFASLELIPGIYTWAWGSGGNADSMTLTIPESSSCLLSLFALCPLMRRRR